jgi:actin-related protein 2
MSLPVIIIDNGSGYLKAGLSTSSYPDCTIPALIGRPMLRYAEQLEDIKLKPIMIGDEVTPVRSLLELTYPMKEGIIQNEDDMEKLWSYTIREKLNQKGDLKDRKVLLTEAPSNPNENKKKMCEILFEKLGVGNVNIEPQAKMTVYAEGLQTAMVLDSGDGVSHCIPIVDNYILHHNIKRLNIAGRHVTEYLIRLLQLKGYAFNSSADFETIRDLKEEFCFVSCDINGDRKLDAETTYYNSYKKLPDGRKIRISNEKFEATEILFNPFLCQSEQPGIHEMVYDSINSCAIDVRKDLYKNIVLSGATTMFPGFTSRLEEEIRNLYKEKNLKLSNDKGIKININIVDSPRRKFSVFSGACVIANTANKNDEIAKEYWITKEEWAEIGADIILKKCPNIIL